MKCYPCLILSILTLPLALFADVLEVPSQFASVQEAVDFAYQMPGVGQPTVIRVAAGEHHGPVVLNHPTLGVPGQYRLIIEGDEDARLMGDGTEPVINCVGMSGICIQGLQIQNDKSIGIKCEKCDHIMIENCSITTVNTEYGTGIKVSECSNVIINDNTISRCGRALTIQNSTDIDINNTVISWCRGQYCGGIRCANSSVSISAEFYFNWDSCLWASNSSTVYLRNAEFGSNETWSESILDISGSTLIADNCIFEAYTHVGRTSIGYFNNSTVEIRQSYFEDSNTGSLYNYASNLTLYGNVFIDNNTSNSTLPLIEIDNSDNQECVIENNLFYGNEHEMLLKGIELAGSNRIQDPELVNEYFHTHTLASPLATMKAGIWYGEFSEHSHTFARADLNRDDSIDLGDIAFYSHFWGNPYSGCDSLETLVCIGENWLNTD